MVKPAGKDSGEGTSFANRLPDIYTRALGVPV